MSESAGRPERRREGQARRRTRPGDGSAEGTPRERSATTPAQRRRTGDQPRLAAYTVMRAVADGGYANLELPRELHRRRLRGRDAAFATELTYGATRMRGVYDRIITIAADRPLTRIDGDVLDTLRLGLHQVLSMRVPPHAAADQSVALARQVNGAGAAGLVNAVLRRVTEADLATWLTRIIPADADRTTALAIEHSHPDWIAKALRQALLGHGRATPETVDAELADLLAADNAPGEVTLALRPGLATLADVESAGARRHPHVRSAALLPGGDPGSLAAVRTGRVAVQDAGSQVVALALATTPRAARPGSGPQGRERWLDLCAGPGGKAGLLAALAIEQHAHLVANEIAPHRAELVTQTLTAATQRAAAAGVDLQVRTGDGRLVGGQEPAAYDRVLIDAPCTGIGALRRRPEARWRRTPQDLSTLGRLQRELLDSALHALAPGGIAAYATCSPHLAETGFVVADVLKRHRDVTEVDARESVAAVTTGWAEVLGPGPAVQLWPHVHDTDGMYLALLRKAG